MTPRPRRPLGGLLVLALVGCSGSDEAAPAAPGEAATLPAAAPAATPSRPPPVRPPRPTGVVEASGEAADPPAGAADPPPPCDPPEEVPGPPPGPPAPVPGSEDRPPIRIEPVGGEPWAELGRRRREEAARRLERWRPLYRRGLRPVAELRGELAAGLRRDSLEGLAGLCARLGRAAERVPGAVVSEAPDRGVGADLAALLAAYAAAGRACAAGRPARAWSQLAAGDRHWAAAGRGLERLAAGAPIPPSLLGRSRAPSLE